MKSDKNAMKVLALALAAVCGAVEAKAQYVDYNIINDNGTGLESFSGSFQGTTLTGFLAGDIEISKTSGGAGLPNTYNTVCTDFGGTLYLGQTYGYSAPQLFSGNSGLAPTWGYTSQYSAAAIENAAALFYNNQAVLGGSDLSAQAGLQLAVWEALYDTGNPNAVLSVGPNSKSAFQVTGGDSIAIADANADLAALTTGAYGTNAPGYNYSGYLLLPQPTIPNGQSDPAQELLIGASDFTPAGVVVVPETGTYAAAVSAVAFLGFLAVGRKPKRS